MLSVIDFIFPNMFCVGCVTRHPYWLMQHIRSVVSYPPEQHQELFSSISLLTDLLSDFTTLYTFKMSRKPPDALYPYGYGKLSFPCYDETDI